MLRRRPSFCSEGLVIGTPQCFCLRSKPPSPLGSHSISPGELLRKRGLPSSSGRPAALILSDHIKGLRRITGTRHYQPRQGRMRIARQSPALSLPKGTAGLAGKKTKRVPPGTDEATEPALGPRNSLHSSTKRFFPRD